MTIEAESVRAYLTEAFLPLGIDLDTVYVTEIADAIDCDVVVSRNLVDEVLHHLRRGEEPTYDQGLFGLFHQPATFDLRYRVRGLHLLDLEKEIGNMLGFG